MLVLCSTKYGSNQLRYGKISDYLTLTSLAPAPLLLASFNFRFLRQYRFLKFRNCVSAVFPERKKIVFTQQTSLFYQGKIELCDLCFTENPKL